MKIAYLSVCKDGTGYANQAINNMLAIEAGGIDVVSRAISLSQSKNHELAKKVQHLENKDTDGVDVVIQHILPNLFEYKGGVKNIGLFCWETTHFSRSNWPSCCNMMDEIWVPSIQNAQAVEDSSVTVPIKILPCACDVTRFENPPNSLNIDNLKDKCVFYTIGEMTRRKNIIAILRAFYTAFTMRDDVALVIKTNVPGKTSDESTSILKSTIDDIKKSLHMYIRHSYYPPVVCVTDFLPDTKLDQLHKSCDVFVSASHGEAWCALPGQFILTENGINPVEKPTTSRIITHKRNLHNSYRHLTRNYKGNAYNIKTTINRLGLKLTDGHKVLAIRGSKCNLDSFENCNCRPNCKIQNSKKCNMLYRNYSTEWIETQNLTVDDYLCIPIPRSNNNDTVMLNDYTSYPVNMEKFITCSGTSKIPQQPYDMNAFAWLIGLYAAEGFSHGRAINFAIGKHETQLYKKLLYYLRKAFGKHFTINSKMNKGSRIVSAHSVILVQIMNKLCGKGAHKKYIHSDIINLNAKLRGYYIRGAIDGDGSYKYYPTYSSVSPNLAIGYHQILLSLGIVAGIALDDNSYGFSKNGKIYRVEIAQEESIKQLEKFINKKVIRRTTSTSTSQREHWIDNEYLYVKIKDIKQFVYNGPVYNYSVENDNSYVLNGFAVHNCIPAHDAMGFGNAVILSNWGSFPELTYAQAASYWEPDTRKFKWPGEIDCGWLVKGQLTQCFGHTDSFPDLYTGEELWFDPNMEHLVRCMKQAYSEWRDGSLSVRREAAKKRAAEFSYTKVGKLARQLLHG